MSNRPIPSNNTSGYKGVSYNKKLNKWVARASLNGRRIHIGVFKTALEASQAYEKAEMDLADKRIKYIRTETHNKALKEAILKSPKHKAHVLTMNAEKKGVPLTEEHKHKIGSAGIGRIVSEETRVKIGNAHRGKIVSEEVRLKQSLVRKSIPNLKNRRELNARWKGDGITYRSLHAWIARNKKRTGVCIKCGAIGKTHFANISGEYLRDIDDFMELCIKCHHEYDNIHQKIWETRRKRGTI